MDKEKPSAVKDPTIPILIRIPISLKEALKNAAWYYKQSTNAYINELLRYGLRSEVDGTNEEELTPEAKKETGWEHDTKKPVPLVFSHAKGR